MTAEQLRRAVENHIGPETRLPGFLSIAGYVLSRIYAFGLVRDGWSFDFTKAVLNTEASYSTGTVDVTQESTAVTGNSTVWTGITLTRHKMNIGGVHYPITTITDDTNIVLTDEYAGETDTAVEYSIFLDEYVLPALTMLHSVWDASNDRRLCGIPRTLLGDYDVARNASPGDPSHYSIVGRTAAGVPILQLFPAPSSIARIEYWYQADYTRVADIGDSIDLPTAYDALLVQGAIGRANQVLRREGWREEWALFEQMMMEAWHADRPQRDAKVRLMRADRMDNYPMPQYAGWQEVSA